MKEPNYLKIHNCTVIKIIIVWDKKTALKEDLVTFKTVYPDEKTFYGNHLSNIFQTDSLYFKDPSLEASLDSKVKLWLLNFLLLLDTKNFRGHIIGLQADTLLTLGGKIGLPVLCQQNTLQKKPKVFFVFLLLSL